jgi:hypothetical protein
MRGTVWEVSDEVRLGPAARGTEESLRLAAMSKSRKMSESVLIREVYSPHNTRGDVVRPGRTTSSRGPSPI